MFSKGTQRENIQEKDSIRRLHSIASAIWEGHKTRGSGMSTEPVPVACLPCGGLLHAGADLVQ